MMIDWLVSVQRTAGQAAAHWLVLQGTRLGVELPGDMISDALVAASFAVFYAAYRAAEQRWPAITKMFGTLKQPHYYADTGDIQEKN